MKHRFFRRASEFGLCVLAVVGLAKTCEAQIGFSNIFEVRPPRVRVATLDEVSDTRPRSYSFAGKPVEPTDPQSSILLTNADPLVAVFPVRDFANSDRSIYSVAGVEVDSFDISIDFYAFANPFSGSTDSISPPLEQTVFLGALPAGSYSIDLRYCSLTTISPASIP